MTGSEMLDRSLKLLGYSDSDNNSHLTQTVRNRALPIINMVTAELSRCCDAEWVPLKTLSDKIDIIDKVINEVALPGIAMYIAQAEGDSGAQAFWGAEYNAKRTTLSKTAQIKDVLPNIWG